MPPQDPKNRPRQGSGDSLDHLLDQQPERRAVRHSAVDGVPQAPPRRTATLPQMAALRAPPIITQPEPALPRPGQAPVEYAATLRAPSTTARTIPTPASGVSVVDATEGQPAPSTPLPPPSQDPAEATILAARRRAEAAEARVAELERQARVRAETASPATFPPKVTPAPASVAPASSGGKADMAISDAAIGRGVRHLLKRFWPLLLGAVGLGAGGVGIAKPAASPAKAEAVAVELQALKSDHALVVEQLTGVLKRDVVRARYLDCLTSDYDEAFSSLLPSPDKQGSVRKPKPWVAKCAALKP